MEFCHRLSQRTGRRYTLPSEAQWEYACRAGTTTPFHFGATLTPDLANYDGNYVYGNGPKGNYRKQTTDVTSFPANPWGLYDMHGNVWEWCLDESAARLSATSTTRTTATSSSVSASVASDPSDARRLLRGGSWYSLPANCRSAYRLDYPPDIRNNNIGFRVCCLPQG